MSNVKDLKHKNKIKEDNALALYCKKILMKKQLNPKTNLVQRNSKVDQKA